MRMGRGAPWAQDSEFFTPGQWTPEGAAPAAARADPRSAAGDWVENRERIRRAQSHPIDPHDAVDPYLAAYLATLPDEALNAAGLDRKRLRGYPATLENYQRFDKALVAGGDEGSLRYPREDRENFGSMIDGFESPNDAAAFAYAWRQYHADRKARREQLIRAHGPSPDEESDAQSPNPFKFGPESDSIWGEVTFGGRPAVEHQEIGSRRYGAFGAGTAKPVYFRPPVWPQPTEEELERGTRMVFGEAEAQPRVGRQGVAGSAFAVAAEKGVPLASILTKARYNGLGSPRLAAMTSADRLAARQEVLAAYDGKAPLGGARYFYGNYKEGWEPRWALGRPSNLIPDRRQRHPQQRLIGQVFVERPADVRVDPESLRSAFGPPLRTPRERNLPDQELENRYQYLRRQRFIDTRAGKRGLSVNPYVSVDPGVTSRLPLGSFYLDRNGDLYQRGRRDRLVRRFPQIDPVPAHARAPTAEEMRRWVRRRG